MTSNQFQLVAHPSLLGVLGLLNVWMSSISDAGGYGDGFVGSFGDY